MTSIEGNHMRYWRPAELLFIAVGAILFLSAIYYDIDLANSGSPCANVASGATYFHDVHGKIAYITIKQKHLLDALFGISMVGFILAVIIDHRKHPFDER